MELHNGNWVMSICKLGMAYTKHQPGINLWLTQGAQELQINLYKLLQFVEGYAGVKIMTYCNLLHTDKKWRVAVKQLFGVRLDRNRGEHVKAMREAPGYSGDTECDIKGVHCSVCQASGAIDGTGPTLSFNNHHRGTHSAVVAASGITKKPVDFDHFQASPFCLCSICSLFPHTDAFARHRLSVISAQ